MEIRKRSVLLGVSIASGAALVASATAADAASPAYNSTASATAGALNLGNGPPGPPNTSTASNAKPSAGTMTGITSKDLPNGLGTIFVTNDGDVLSTHAQVFPDGTSVACSAVASGACGQRSQPLDVRLNLNRIVTVANSMLGGGEVPFSDLRTLPGNLNDYSIVLGITGPAAMCTAGPAVGSLPSAFRVSRPIISGTVDLQYGTKSVIGGPKAISNNGDVLQPLINGVLAPILAKIPNNNVALKYTAGTDSGAGVGPSTSAQDGTLVVTVSGTTAVTLTGGKVSCGPNQQASSTAATSPSSGGSGGAGGAGKPGSKPTGTKPGLTSPLPSLPLSKLPLKPVQTAGGRYASASSDTPLSGIPLWADLAAVGMALAGGFALGRNRKRAG